MTAPRTKLANRSRACPTNELGIHVSPTLTILRRFQTPYSWEEWCVGSHPPTQELVKGVRVDGNGATGWSKKMGFVTPPPHAADNQTKHKII